MGVPPDDVAPIPCDHHGDLQNPVWEFCDVHEVFLIAENCCVKIVVRDSAWAKMAMSAFMPP